MKLTTDSVDVRVTVIPDPTAAWPFGQALGFEICPESDVTIAALRAAARAEGKVGTFREAITVPDLLDTDSRAKLTQWGKRKPSPCMDGIMIMSRAELFTLYGLSGTGAAPCVHKRARRPEGAPVPGPRTLSLAEVNARAERAAERVSKWPEWKRELSEPQIHGDMRPRELHPEDFHVTAHTPTIAPGTECRGSIVANPGYSFSPRPMVLAIDPAGPVCALVPDMTPAPDPEPEVPAVRAWSLFGRSWALFGKRGDGWRCPGRPGCGAPLPLPAAEPTPAALPKAATAAKPRRPRAGAGLKPPKRVAELRAISD